MLDIKYYTIKQYCADNGIKSPKQYTDLWRVGKLPSNFPHGIVAYLKTHDQDNFVSLDDLFPERKSVRLIHKTAVVKPPKTRYIKKVKISKPLIITQKSLRIPYAEALPIVRAMGFTTEQEWQQYSASTDKHSWDHRIPKTPKLYYTKTGEWKSWSHFLIGDHVPIKMSQGEKEVFRLLADEGVYFEMNKKFPDLKNGKLSFDFYIPSANQLIEYDGIYHFHRLKRTEQQFQRQLANDLLKYQYTVDKGFKFIRIAYYEHNYIPTILFNIGLIKSPDVTLLRKERKNRPLSAIPKNYKYNSSFGNYSFDEVHKMRQLYLSGNTRLEIQNILGIKTNRDSFSEMMRNRTYFDPKFDPKTRVIIPKPVSNKKPVVKIDPLLLLEFKNAKIKKQEVYSLFAKPRIEKINLLKEQIIETKKLIKNLPKNSKIVKSTVSNITINKLNFPKFGEYKHYGRYTYKNFDFKGKSVKGEITCKLHGGFTQTPHNHLSVNKSSQCPKCAKENVNHSENLPWRDVRDLRKYNEKVRILPRVNKELRQQHYDLIQLFNNEIKILESEITQELIKANQEIDRVKSLLYPTYKPTPKVPMIYVSPTTTSQPSVRLVNVKNIEDQRKLTYENVVFILQNPTIGTISLGKQFNVNESTIRKIRNGERYKDFINQYFETQKKLAENFLQNES